MLPAGAVPLFLKTLAPFIYLLLNDPSKSAGNQTKFQSLEKVSKFLVVVPLNRVLEF